MSSLKDSQPSSQKNFMGSHPPMQSKSTQGYQSQVGLHCPYMGLPKTAREDRAWSRDVSPDVILGQQLCLLAYCPCH